MVVDQHDLIDQASCTLDILDEVEQRQRRMNNVMIFGLPESTEALADRRRFDEANIQELFSEVGAVGICPINFRRIGKIVEGRCRPLRVEMSATANADRVIRSGRKLRNSSRFRRVFVSKDLTKSQQEEVRNLRTELVRRRDLGEDVVIFRNQVHARESLPVFHE